MTDAPADEFVERFGQLDLAPRHPENDADKSLALYDVHSRARRYTFENEPGNAWAVDTKTGERAFRVDSKGRTYLPNGREIATPRAVARPAREDPAAKLYGTKPHRSTAPAAVRHQSFADEQRIANALYGKGR